MAVHTTLYLLLDSPDGVRWQLNLVLAVQEVVLELESDSFRRIFQQVEGELDVGLAPLHHDLNSEEQDILARSWRWRRHRHLQLLVLDAAMK
eukprot:CAMPEP_0185597472 /NCGR_PEP_ID=MMETSP0434-20130131/81388_1 /TAXON_ID=626734 ORGANISM="Favella taraikaensis, Strain Fe Narragansett Bay" /NCGR_SAMPLE_ID=MMETSP0434 /ASSEMBLY_ACC=CAM_ASM_000379 /LENGTH=91 /DNA_ID=CAMNT_0028226205 /DNA_START=3897 /DNA_END=4169 /DNA_ORIENTATION=+